ncbi:hypothetical protein BASA60_011426 [Batrachochytrium salamandrivorans]|nr:hypothetical protein BASA60_011426 [Batrachochytrium salamandrivorans]KAH9267353.1 hypothetical protein BASA84_000688 [Batrachochytrium salamandrivorans]
MVTASSTTSAPSSESSMTAKTNRTLAPGLMTTTDLQSLIDDLLADYNNPEGVTHDLSISDIVQYMETIVGPSNWESLACILPESLRRAATITTSTTTTIPTALSPIETTTITAPLSPITTATTATTPTTDFRNSYLSTSMAMIRPSTSHSPSPPLSSPLLHAAHRDPRRESRLHSDMHQDDNDDNNDDNNDDAACIAHVHPHHRITAVSPSRHHIPMRSAKIPSPSSIDVELMSFSPPRTSRNSLLPAAVASPQTPSFVSDFPIYTPRSLSTASGRADIMPAASINNIVAFTASPAAEPHWSLPSYSPSLSASKRGANSISRRISHLSNVTTSPSKQPSIPLVPSQPTENHILNNNIDSPDSVDITSHTQKPAFDWISETRSPDLSNDLFRESAVPGLGDDDSGNSILFGGMDTPGGLVRDMSDIIMESDASLASNSSSNSSKSRQRLQRQLDDAYNAIRDTEERNRTLQSELDSASQLIQSQHRELHSSRSTIETLNDDLLQIRTRFNELLRVEFISNDLSGKLEREKAKCEEISDASHQELMAKQEALDEIQKKHREQATLLQKILDKVKSLETCNMGLSSEIKSLQMENMTAQNKYFDEHDIRTQLENEVANLTFNLKMSKETAKEIKDSVSIRNTNSLAVEMQSKSSLVDSHSSATQTDIIPEDNSIALLERQLKDLADEFITLEGQKIAFRREMYEVRDSAIDTRRALRQRGHVEAEVKRHLQSLADDLAHTEASTKTIQQDLSKEAELQKRLYKEVVERPHHIEARITSKQCKNAYVQVGVDTKDSASECISASNGALQGI